MGTIESTISVAGVRNRPPLPFEKVIPEWVYDLAHISNTQAVLTAHILKRPKYIEVDGRSNRKRVVLRYADVSYTWDDVLEMELYTVEDVMYILWRYSNQWYAATVYTTL